MNHEQLDRAEQLASRNYNTVVERDTLTDGSPVYLASNPELPGCMSQGATSEEAVKNLRNARVDYIYMLLEDGLPVPETSERVVKWTVKL